MNTPRLPSANNLEKVTEPSIATIVNVHCHEDTLIVVLSEGREVSAPTGD